MHSDITQAVRWLEATPRAAAAAAFSSSAFAAASLAPQVQLRTRAGAATPRPEELSELRRGSWPLTDAIKHLTPTPV